MRKLMICFVCIIFFCNINMNINISQINASSLNFEETLNILNVPKFNKSGYSINEKVYRLYNVFSYSSPEYISKLTSEQRFKKVIEGLWSKNGEQGEYYILGFDYKGDYIYNYKFPVDYMPENYPDKLQYLPFNNNNSWTDKNKYLFIEQLEYMKNTKLRFDKINFNNNTANSYEQVEYNMTANSIGLDKMLLSTCSTWKTSGIIYAIRKTNTGQYRNMIFSTAPMAANADIKSRLEIEPEFEEDILKITFGANIINLNKYTTKNQVKKIESKLYINNKFIAKIEQENCIDIFKSIQFQIDRENILNNKINIKVESLAYTAFAVDGIMEDQIEKSIEIKDKVKEKLEEEIEEKRSINLSLGLLKSNNNKLYVSELLKTDITQLDNSIGMIEKDRNLVLKLDTNFELNEKAQIQINIDNKLVEDVEKIANNKYKILISNNVDSTIFSWGSIRQVTKSYFIDKNIKVGKRIRSPNLLKVSIIYEGEIIENSIYFDTIDSFWDNMNHTFENDIINLKNFNELVEVQIW